MALSSEVPKNSENYLVPLNQKLYLGFASVGANILSMILWGALMSYYLDVLKMDPAMYGTVILLFGIWNALNDPLFGYISDRKKAIPGRGKRIFFLKLGIPIYLIGFFIVWLPEASWGDAALFVVLLVGLFFFDTAHTIYVLNHCAIQTGMTDNPKERTSINLIVTYVGIIPYALIGFVPTYVLTSNLPREMIFLIFGICGVIAAIFMIIGSWKIRENLVFYKDEQPLPLKESLRSTFQSKSFLIFLVYSFAMGGVALSVGQMTITYFKYVFNLQGMNALIPGIVSGGIQIVFYPIMERINRRVGLRSCLLIFMSVAMIGYLGLFLVNSFVLMTVFLACCQLGTSCHWLLFNAMIGDITDEDELKTHQRREGAFFGVNALISAPAQSIIIWLFTLIIAAYGYEDAFGETPSAESIPNAVLGIKIGIGLLPLGFLILGLIALWLFPLHGKRYQQLKQEVLALHSKNMNQT